LLPFCFRYAGETSWSETPIAVSPLPSFHGASVLLPFCFRFASVILVILLVSALASVGKRAMVVPNSMRVGGRWVGAGSPLPPNTQNGVPASIFDCRVDLLPFRFRFRKVSGMPPNCRFLVIGGRGGGGPPTPTPDPCRVVAKTPWHVHCRVFAE